MYYDNTDLRNKSDRFASLVESNKNCRKNNTIVNDDEDLIELINTIDYWDICGDIPLTVLHYVDSNKTVNFDYIKKSIPNYRDYEKLFESLKYMSDGKYADALLLQIREVYKYLILTNKYPYDEILDPCAYAATVGDLDLLEFSWEHGCERDSGIPWIAAQNGHINCLKFLHRNKCPWDSSTTHTAVQTNNLECLKYAIENSCPYNINELLHLAKGNNTIIDYLLQI